MLIPVVKDIVALRKESVDRNLAVTVSVTDLVTVALRKESVDRNRRYVQHAVSIHQSLSARRAWIEIASMLISAMLKRSLSARRAWIEMADLAAALALSAASLSARRAWIEIA